MVGVVLDQGDSGGGDEKSSDFGNVFKFKKFAYGLDLEDLQQYSRMTCFSFLFFAKQLFLSSVYLKNRIRATALFRAFEEVCSYFCRL